MLQAVLTVVAVVEPADFADSIAVALAEEVACPVVAVTAAAGKPSDIVGKHSTAAEVPAALVVQEDTVDTWSLQRLVLLQKRKCFVVTYSSSHSVIVAEEDRSDDENAWTASFFRGADRS